MVIKFDIDFEEGVGLGLVVFKGKLGELNICCIVELFMLVSVVFCMIKFVVEVVDEVFELGCWFFWSNILVGLVDMVNY